MEQPLHNKIFGSTGCLTEEQLNNYGAKSLSPGERHMVEKHLLECELCSEAMEGFAIISGKKDLNDIREEVRNLVLKGGSTSGNYWKIFLLAASFTGVAFITFYFIFKGDGLPEKKIIAENVLPVQTGPVEIAEAEKQTTNELAEKTGTRPEVNITGGEEVNKKKESKKADGKFTNRLLQGENKAIRNSNTIVLAKAEGEVADNDKTSEKNEITRESAPASSPEEVAQIHSTAEPEQLKPENDFERSAMDKSTSQDKKAAEEKIVIQENVEPAGFFKRKNEDGVFSKNLKPAQGKKEPALSKSNDLKYVENLKVVDYEVAPPSPQAGAIYSLPAKFENAESEKNLNAGDDIQTLTISYDLVLKEGLALIEKRKYKESLEKFNLIMQSRPADLNALFYSGIAFYNLGNFDMALVNFKKTIEAKDPAFYDEAKWYEGLSYQGKNEREKAAQIFKEISGRENFYKIRAEERLKEMDKK